MVGCGRQEVANGDMVSEGIIRAAWPWKSQDTGKKETGLRRKGTKSSCSTAINNVRDIDAMHGKSLETTITTDGED